MFNKNILLWFSMTDFTKRAKELENENNFEGALNYYEMAIEEKSGPFDIRSDMGRVLNKMKRYEESIDCFDMVLMMRENHLNSLFGKGIANLGLNNWKEALDYFLKANRLDVNNPNFWYYSSIILRELNDEENSEIAYGKFLELDEERFKKERLYYDFGLLFNEREVELKKGDKHYNIDGYKALLSSYNLTEEEILSYLRTTPLDELENKISIINQENSKNQELKIIYDEFNKMGLDNDDIRQLLEIETIESLKEDIKSRTKTDPFIISQEMPELQLYDFFKSMPINHAYNYKISDELEFEEIKIHIIQEEDYNKSSNKNKGVVGKLGFLVHETSKKAEEIISNTLFGSSKKQNNRQVKKQSYEKERKTKKFINQNLKRLNNAIFEGNYGLANELFNLIYSYDLTKFDDLRVKLMFYKGLFEYYEDKDFEKALETLTMLTSEFPQLNNNFTYLYHKACILYDLGRYDESLLILDNILTHKNIKNINRDYINYLKSSCYYYETDFINAYESYKEISAENQNIHVLNEICKK